MSLINEKYQQHLKLKKEKKKVYFHDISHDYRYTLFINHDVYDRIITIS